MPLLGSLPYCIISPLRKNCALAVAAPVEKTKTKRAKPLFLFSAFFYSVLSFPLPQVFRPLGRRGDRASHGPRPPVRNPSQPGQERGRDRGRRLRPARPIRAAGEGLVDRQEAVICFATLISPPSSDVRSPPCHQSVMSKLSPIRLLCAICEEWFMSRRCIAVSYTPPSCLDSMPVERRY